MLPLLSWGQAQINTKKMKINDFTQKVTKVVLSGNEFMDSALQNEVAAIWRVSPYEFCTHEEFTSLMTSDEYYFLLITYGQFKKESKASIQFLSLLKGWKWSRSRLHRHRIRQEERSSSFLHCSTSCRTSP